MLQTPSKRPAKPAARHAGESQRCLVIGVSDYPDPRLRLPAVAADIAAMAKLLSSRKGLFTPSGVTVLADKHATKAKVLSSLRTALSRAVGGDTVFVYIAGHGKVEKGEYYFAPYDADPARLAETGVPLSDIKGLFDRTPSRRTFLWLDFCHSGGILARSVKTAELTAIRRAIGVVSGEGKIIVAACTSEQSAFEDPKIGHGLFTHALVRGLKGEANSAQGEVTAHSLYEFIDHQVAQPLQRPVFFGETTGRIVLMHYPDRHATAGAPAKPSSRKAATKPTASGAISSSGNLLLLGGRFHVAREVTVKDGGTVELRIIAKTAEEEAVLGTLRNDRYGQRRTVSFAFRNQAFLARVESVSSVTAGAKPEWFIALAPESSQGSSGTGFGYGQLSVDELALSRARLLLLGEKPQGDERGLLSIIERPFRSMGMTAPPLSGTQQPIGLSPADSLRRARLWLVYYAKTGDVCDDILELRLGPVRSGKVSVRFRGIRRNQRSDDEPAEVVVEGDYSFNEQPSKTRRTALACYQASVNWRKKRRTHARKSLEP